MSALLPKEGDLRVVHIPQVPCDGFHVPVESVEQGVFVMKLLAEYDLFQLEHHIKPDYSNAQFLEVFEGGEWLSWVDEATGEDNPLEYLRQRVGVS